jgi:hypothetical protein
MKESKLLSSGFETLECWVFLVGYWMFRWCHPEFCNPAFSRTMSCPEIG